VAALSKKPQNISDIPKSLVGKADIFALPSPLCSPSIYEISQGKTGLLRISTALTLSVAIGCF